MRVSKKFILDLFDHLKPGWRIKDGVPPPPPEIDPFEHKLPPAPRSIPTGRGGYDRPPAPPNAGKENEDHLRVFAERHVPSGQRYEHYSRGEKKSKGCDAAYVDVVTGKIVTPLEYKSTRRYTLTKKEFAMAMETHLDGREYWIVTPKGYDVFNPLAFIPSGTMQYVGLN